MKLNKYNLIQYIYLLLNFIIIAIFSIIDENNINYLNYIINYLNKYKYT
jgi:hypothetical protein